MSGKKNQKAKRSRKKIWMDFATINGKTNPVLLPARRTAEKGFDLQEQLSKGLVESFMPAIKM